MKYIVGDKNKTKFNHYVKRALELAEGGLINEEIIKFYELCFLITGLITNGVKHAQILTNMIRHILMKNIITSGIELLEKINIDDRDNVSKKYKFIGTMNMSIKEFSKKKYTIHGIDIELLNFFKVNDMLKIDRFFESEWMLYRESQIKEYIDYNYIYISVEASDKNEAYEIAYRNCELFRGLVNFSNYYMSQGFRGYGGIPQVKTYSLFQPPKLMALFDDKNNFLFDRFHIGFYDYSINRMSNYQHDNLDNLINIINNLHECTLRDRILYSFIRYNFGLDGYVSGTSFFELWKILELLSLSDTYQGGLPTKRVANRISSLFSVNNDYYRDIINTLSEKRNYIVHEGRLNEFNQDEFNIIKTICEYAIMQILYLVNEVQDENTLNCYYENINKNNNELEKIEQVINKIKQNREKTIQRNPK